MALADGADWNDDDDGDDDLEDEELSDDDGVTNLYDVIHNRDAYTSPEHQMLTELAKIVQFFIVYF